jgi:excinuclease ABC subunit B
MKTAVGETRRRRKIQETYNKTHHITPETIKKEIVPVFSTQYQQTGENTEIVAESLSDFSSTDDINAKIKQFEKKMDLAARDLEFEKAARFRDRIEALKELMLFEL